MTNHNPHRNCDPEKCFYNSPFNVNNEGFVEMDIPEGAAVRYEEGIIDFDSLDLEEAIHIIGVQQNMISDLRDMVKYYQEKLSSSHDHWDKWGGK